MSNDFCHRPSYPTVCQNSSVYFVLKTLLGVFRVTPWEYSKSEIFRFLTKEYSATLNTSLSNRSDLYEFFSNPLISPSPNCYNYSSRKIFSFSRNVILFIYFQQLCLVYQIKKNINYFFFDSFNFKRNIRFLSVRKSDDKSDEVFSLFHCNVL